LHDVRDILLVTNPQFNLGLVTRRVEQLHSYKILDTVISLCFFSGIFPPLLHCCLHRTISFLPQFYTGLAKRCFARWLFRRADSWLVDVLYEARKAMLCKVAIPKSGFLTCGCFMWDLRSDALQVPHLQSTHLDVATAWTTELTCGRRGVLRTPEKWRFAPD
jgi:hypothetical protein